MSDKLVFTATAFKEYLHWQTQDRRTLKRINLLLNEILRNPNELGIGKGERLSGNLSGYYSRRIDDFNRLIYRILDNESIEILHCQGHYSDR